MTTEEVGVVRANGATMRAGSLREPIGYAMPIEEELKLVTNGDIDFAVTFSSEVDDAGVEVVGQCR